MSGRLPAVDERALIDHIVTQRWFGSKSREVVGARVIDGVALRAEVSPRLYLLLVEIRFPEGTHELYQVLAGAREGRKSWYDALTDPALKRELVHQLRAGATEQTA